MTALSSIIRMIEAKSSGLSRREIIEAAAADDLGELAWRECDRDRHSEALHDLPGWPRCGCTACGCEEPATTTDDGGVAVCDQCADYTVDRYGDVHCARCDDVERVVESCGAGGQTRSYVRLTPPPMPEPDPDGRYACYWDTVGDGARVVSRHETRDAAEQAVLAHDWPPPSDRTEYLCGYEVRHLVDGRWVR